MIRLAAVIVLDSSPARFAGLDLVERALRLARRAGADQIRIVEDAEPFAIASDAALTLVLPERVIVEPALVRAFVERGLREFEDAAVLVDGDMDSTDVMLLSPEAVARVRTAPRAHAALRRLMVEAIVAAVPCGDRFCARLTNLASVPAVEHEYMRVTNGGDGEGLFTRNIRRLSIPVSRRLVQVRVTANLVTLAGFALAVGAGIAFAAGSYGAGLAGALLYGASMVLDCSDGEIARATLGDSRFGAWLETITDYLSYFVVLGGIVAGDARVEGFCKHAVSAIVAAAASFAIVSLVGYLRAKVASENPGGFDDALAADLKKGTRVQRLAAWGRQLIKRSFVAHLILFQAVIGQLPALTEIWAVGSVAALVVVLAVHTHVIRTVRPALVPAATV